MTLPVFETPRLTLRPITAHDAEGLHEAYGDADAMRHWDLPPSRDVSEMAERIRMSAEADPLGFTEEGTLRDWLCVAGERRSVVMYSLLRTEWMTRA